MTVDEPRSTYRVGLLGHGIGPSLTPAMHVREGVRLGLDYHYEIVDLAEQPDVDLGVELGRLETAGFAATNITHPFKQAVLDHVDSCSDVVDRLGAANLVVLGADGRAAHNTDYRGFRSSLEGFLGSRPRGAVLQVGAGGAGRATACVLLDLGFDQVVVHDVSEAATRALLERFDDGSGRLTSTGGDLEGWSSRVEGVVHVTPTGMLEHPGVALDVDTLRSDAWVAEVVYRPLETELVRRARARGLDTLDGGAMAVGQAVESIKLITGMEPDTARMLAHFQQLVSSQREESA